MPGFIQKKKQHPGTEKCEGNGWDFTVDKGTVHNIRGTEGCKEQGVDLHFLVYIRPG